MLRYSHTNIGIPPKRIGKTVRSLRSSIEHLRGIITRGGYDDPRASINLPSDVGMHRAMQQFLRSINTRKLNSVILIGIGGSSLGAKAIYDAQFGFFDNLMPERHPKLLVFDTTDPTFAAHLARLLKRVHRDEVLINVVSKSGSTTETRVNMKWLLKEASWKRRTVITTDRGSPLWTYAEHEHIPLLEIPASVGGRYSVFSPAGLFPLAVTGVRINALLTGARAILPSCLTIDPRNNPAAQIAATLFLGRHRGYTIHDTFLFAPQCESLGKWYRQLLAESIGKNQRDGITPTVSIGSSDLHSVAQLRFAGQRDTMTTFVTAKKMDGPRELGRTLATIATGVMRAYAKAKLPFMEIELPDTHEQSLGQYMQLMMVSTMYLGALFKVNAFDQPAVELYKKEVRQMLKNN